MDYILNTLSNLVHQTAFLSLTWGNYLMILVAFVFVSYAVWSSLPIMTQVSKTEAPTGIP